MPHLEKYDFLAPAHTCICQSGGSALLLHIIAALLGPACSCLPASLFASREEQALPPAVLRLRSVSPGCPAPLLPAGAEPGDRPCPGASGQPTAAPLGVRGYGPPRGA